jgi:Zn-finger nucleic acid-binding protein
MQCPVCDDEKLVISSREGVEIDYCAQCRGVWLDRGELDKIIDRASPGGPAAAPATAPAPERRDDRDDRRGYDDDDRRSSGKKKKRGGFLEDLFDF